MNDVTPPPTNTVYQLWLIDAGHPPTSAGIIDTTAASTRAVVEGIDTSAALGISVEPPGGSAQPTTVVGAIALS